MTCPTCQRLVGAIEHTAPSGPHGETRMTIQPSCVCGWRGEPVDVPESQRATDTEKAATSGRRKAELAPDPERRDRDRNP